MRLRFRVRALRHEGGPMASEPKRKDPTEAALSAIEQALDLGAAPDGRARPDETGEPRLPDVGDALPLSQAPRRPVEGEGVALIDDAAAAEPVAPTPAPPRRPEVVSP